ncbi:MAG TPA: PEGA domain-containing protein [Chitinispirillaceae bacterium]|nr:PEGA domain-containing protein [Chitinispirillaceae bacterium]
MKSAFNPENETRNNLIMLFSIKLQSAFPDTIYTIQVDLVKINEIDGTQKSQSTSFISLSFGTGEINTVKNVLSRKIIENLRIQYVCHLRVQSSPQGARIKTDSGLEGVAPLEWIVPVGVLNIEGQLKGYEAIKQTIELNEPGAHTCHLQLHKKAFYHSRMMIPGTALLLTSAVCFFSERYYIDKYHDMQKNAGKNDPTLVEKTFNRSKNFGYLGTASLVLSAISFSLTFKF